jgi:hypothetical protein
MDTDTDKESTWTFTGFDFVIIEKVKHMFNGKKL